MLMTQTTGHAIEQIAASHAQAGRVVLRDLLTLSKPGITRLVLVTTGVGFALAAMQRHWTVSTLAMTSLLCMLGTALCSSGANALNMSIEHRRDALMRRTCQRPIPMGRVSPGGGMLFGAVCSLLGALILLAGVNAAAALVAICTVVLYVTVYTPMKPMSPLSTIVGAIPGALPPLIGWVAAAPGHGPEALAVWGGWSLVAIMVIWQMPHFHAIAWMYRDDYERGGHRVLAVVDPTGKRVAIGSLFWLALLLPVSLSPIWALPLSFGWIYGIVAVALWAVFTRAGIRFARDRSRNAAKRLFLASIAHLPLLLFALVADAALAMLLG
jgi:protoheme IX farnesyltransferase